MKNSKLKQILIALSIPLLTGGIASLLTKNDMKAFKNIAQPPLSPPQWLFPVVWSILYSMMGYASYLVYKENDSPSDVKKALALYCIQLIFNFGWTIIFFHFDTYYFAFACSSYYGDSLSPQLKPSTMSTRQVHIY